MIARRISQRESYFASGRAENGPAALPDNARNLRTTQDEHAYSRAVTGCPDCNCVRDHLDAERDHRTGLERAGTLAGSADVAGTASLRVQPAWLAAVRVWRNDEKAPVAVEALRTVRTAGLIGTAAEFARRVRAAIERLIRILTLAEASTGSETALSADGQAATGWGRIDLRIWRLVRIRIAVAVAVELGAIGAIGKTGHRGRIGTASDEREDG